LVIFASIGKPFVLTSGRCDLRDFVTGGAL
jgi:hypothetical protein